MKAALKKILGIGGSSFDRLLILSLALVTLVLAGMVFNSVREILSLSSSAKQSVPKHVRALDTLTKISKTMSQISGLTFQFFTSQNVRRERAFDESLNHWMAILDQDIAAYSETMHTEKMSGHVMGVTQELSVYHNILHQVLRKTSIRHDAERLRESARQFHLSESRLAELIQQETGSHLRYLGESLQEVSIMHSQAAKTAATEGVIAIFATLVTAALMMRRLRSLHYSLASKSSELEQFAYTVSHDLRNSVTSISLLVQLLKRKLMQQEPVGDVIGVVDKMQNAVQGSLDFINQTLSLARSGRTIEAFEVVSLDKLLSELRSEWSVRLEEVHGELDWSQPAPSVSGDPSRLKQAFDNIFSNSIKYRREDVALRIHVGFDKNHQWTLIRISDNGQGISEDQRHRVFNLFVRGKALSKEPSTGIGLATVRKIVEAHHGMVEIEPSSVPGTTVVIRLPTV